MSARYQASLTIPPEFPALLKGFTREVLRTQVSECLYRARVLRLVRARKESTYNSLIGYVRACKRMDQEKRLHFWCFCLQPEDIYVFGTQYFSELLAVTGVEGEVDGKGASSRSTPPGTKVPQQQQHGQVPTQGGLNNQQQPNNDAQTGGQSAIASLDINELSPQEVEAMIMRK